MVANVIAALLTTINQLIGLECLWRSMTQFPVMLLNEVSSIA